MSDVFDATFVVKLLLNFLIVGMRLSQLYLTLSVVFARATVSVDVRVNCKCVV